ncbi:MAG TPA: type II toxin-antitoxin system RelE/ParE family toxin [Vicinamibacteria bacterium]|nr:type II toxin-antitoxin system RelE/ParE family toxin [Vicinamibacteria bacterium]
MIKSFRDNQSERIWRGEFSKRLPPDMQSVARRKLRMLNNARDLTDLRVPPANRLERLKGGRHGQYSIRINDQWRVCFVWSRGDAYDVEIADYHR